MLSAAMQSWFGRPLAIAVAPAPEDDAPRAPEATLPTPVQTRTLWPTERLSVTDQLWGSGYLTPGGEVETLRLVRPLGLSSASNLLLVGMGGGGAVSSIVRNTGAWVSGLEVDPSLVTRAQSLMKAGQLGKKASLDVWDPENPNFARQRHHHCLALEPLRSGHQAEPILDGLAHTLKAGGQLVMIEMVADEPLAADDAAVVRWAKLERRRLAAIPTANGVSRMLGRVGFDVRIVEDISIRLRKNTVSGWRVSVRELAKQRPTPIMAAHLVGEAEMWMLQMRLVREKRLKMIRWHAIARGTRSLAVQPERAAAGAG